MRNPVHDLSPSAKLVYRVLTEEEECTTDTIATEAPLSKSTVRNAIRELRRAGLLETRPNPRDARKTLYSIST